jgi:hypothetical protein
VGDLKLYCRIEGSLVNTGLAARNDFFNHYFSPDIQLGFP